jgi:hypothetical protein
MNALKTSRSLCLRGGASTLNDAELYLDGIGVRGSRASAACSGCAKAAETPVSRADMIVTTIVFCCRYRQVCLH